MSHKNRNPVNPAKPKRVAIVISNPAISTTSGWPVGFWWSELSHPYFKLTEIGHEVEIFSYFGGRCEADAMSDPAYVTQWQAEDVISRGYIHDSEFMKMVENTKPAKDIDINKFDVLLVAGGQGPMFIIEKAIDMLQKFTEFYEAGKIVAALCHGVAILRYAKLSNGEYLAKDKTVTGFSNAEEDFSDEAVWSMGLLSKDKHVMP